MERDTQSPRIIRPIPRRPFDRNLRSPTPPDEDYPANDHTPSRGQPTAPRVKFLGALTPSASFDNNSTSETLSRAASILNLTTSTLFGIYSPSAPTSPTPDELPHTPWGTGAEFPPHRAAAMDDATFDLLRDRAAGVVLDLSASGEGIKTGVRRGSHSSTVRPPMTVRAGAKMLIRVVTLFLLGVGYGVLVGRLRSSSDLFGGVVSPSRREGSDWKFLLFWGVTGVAMGGLLPWFDRVWEDKFGSRFDTGHQQWQDEHVEEKESDTNAQMDWALVVRGIGAFVGIVFAIRKLAWTSTMQVSLALALANPFLWYLIDRSKTGFLLSTAMSLVGTAVLLGLDPDMMPAPTTRTALRNSTGLYRPASAGPALPRQETIETGVWIVSVLFCSCVCFGNIGRRLALDGRAVARGRWGGVR